MDRTADPIKSTEKDPNEGDSIPAKMDEHHGRLMAVEKMLGIKHESHGEEPEETDKMRRHKERGKTQEKLAQRKRR